MTRTRKGNHGIRINKVSYNFSLAIVKDNKVIYQCRKHYKTLQNKDGIFTVDLIDNQYIITEYIF